MERDVLKATGGILIAAAGCGCGRSGGCGAWTAACSGSCSTSSLARLGCLAFFAGGAGCFFFGRRRGAEVSAGALAALAASLAPRHFFAAFAPAFFLAALSQTIFELVQQIDHQLVARRKLRNRSEQRLRNDLLDKYRGSRTRCTDNQNMGSAPQ